MTWSLDDAEALYLYGHLTGLKPAWPGHLIMLKPYVYGHLTGLKPAWPGHLMTLKPCMCMVTWRGWSLHDLVTWWRWSPVCVWSPDWAEACMTWSLDDTEALYVYGHLTGLKPAWPGHLMTLKPCMCMVTWLGWSLHDLVTWWHWSPVCVWSPDWAEACMTWSLDDAEALYVYGHLTGLKPAWPGHLMTLKPCMCMVTWLGWSLHDLVTWWRWSPVCVWSPDWAEACVTWSLDDTEALYVYDHLTGLKPAWPGHLMTLKPCMCMITWLGWSLHDLVTWWHWSPVCVWSPDWAEACMTWSLDDAEALYVYDHLTGLKPAWIHAWMLPCHITSQCISACCTGGGGGGCCFIMAAKIVLCVHWYMSSNRSQPSFGIKLAPKCFRCNNSVCLHSYTLNRTLSLSLS